MEPLRLLPNRLSNKKVPFTESHEVGEKYNEISAVKV